MIDKWMSELEDRATEVTKAEQKKKKNLNESSLRNLWDNIKSTNIHIIKSQKLRREKETGLI